MKVTVFGGTGTAGLLTIDQVLKKGYHVTAYARTPSKVTFKHPNLTVVKGELTEFDKISEVIKGADAVISVLGPTGVSKDTVIANGMKNIIKAMQENNVQRLVAAVSSSYRDPKDKFQFWIDFGVWVLRTIAKPILIDIETTGKVVAECNLDWTMIRLPKLSNQRPKGKFNVGYTGNGKVKNFFLSRTDLASFLAQQLNDLTYWRQAPVVSN